MTLNKSHVYKDICVYCKLERNLALIITSKLKQKLCWDFDYLNFITVDSLCLLLVFCGFEFPKNVAESWKLKLEFCWLIGGHSWCNTTKNLLLCRTAGDELEIKRCHFYFGSLNTLRSGKLEKKLKNSSGDHHSVTEAWSRLFFFSTCNSIFFPMR